MAVGSSGGKGVTFSDSTDNSVTIDDNSSSLESFSNASAEAVARLAEMSKYLSEQEKILKNTRKQWKLMTGGIIGAFYSIAKLSPLFASYISEFGGVLGYVYDTAIIPWSDAIEGLLDIMWGGADAFDESEAGIQKWTGALLIGVPVIAGLLVSLAGFAEILLMIAGGSVVQGIVGLFAGFSAGPILIGAVVVAVALLLLKWTGFIDVWVERSATMRDRMVTWKDDIVAIFVTLKEIAGKLLDRFAPNLLTNMSKGYSVIKTWINKMVEYMSEKVYYLVDLVSPLSNIMKGTSAIRSGLEWVNEDLLGSYATGGTVVQDGMYKLHQGERIMSSTMNNNKNSSSANYITISPQISISGSVSSSMDARKLAADLSRYWMADIQKVVGSGHR